MEMWKAVCKPISGKGEPEIVELLAHGRMHVFNQLHVREDVGQMYYAEKAGLFDEKYTEDAKEDYWKLYSGGFL